MGDISEKDAAKIMMQILAAVEYCHKRNIVHRYFILILRDLKPENIVFEKKDLQSTLKVIDFGRSKILHPKDGFIGRAGSVLNSITQLDLLYSS